MSAEEESFSDSTTVDTPPTETVILEEEEEVEEQPKHKNFVSRVGSIPIIQDINNTSFGRLAVSTANATFTTVNKYQPNYIKSYYEQYIQPHVEKADELGCRSLDLIQRKYPVVNQNTSEIIQNVTAPSYQLIDQRIAPVVDSFEAAIDKYLPVEEKKRDIYETNQAVRAYYLMNSATSRLSQRIPRSRDDLNRFTETSELIQKTTANIESLQEQLVSYVQQYVPPTVVQRVQVIQQTTTEKIGVITQQVSAQLTLVLDFIQQQTNESPEWLKSRIASLVNIANKQIDIIRTQYAREDIQPLEKAKQIAQAIQAQFVPILQNIQSQLIYYSDLAREKATQDLKSPFKKLGFHPKLTTTQ